MLKSLFDNVDISLKADWRTRSERSRFVARLAEQRAIRSILNVGSGGKRELAEQIVSRTLTVFDIDISGDCDLKLNLDSVDALPFSDGEFEMVCAMDVLEHLNNFHRINGELFRVSSKYVLISLPNSACEIVSIILNKGSFGSDSERGYYSKYYGLPLVVPEDRHRWWLYPQDIVRFYQRFASDNNCVIRYYLPSLDLKGRVLSLLLGRRLRTTFLLPHIAILLEKR